MYQLLMLIDVDHWCCGGHSWLLPTHTPWERSRCFATYGTYGFWGTLTRGQLCSRLESPMNCQRNVGFSYVWLKRELTVLANVRTIWVTLQTCKVKSTITIWERGCYVQRLLNTYYSSYSYFRPTPWCRWNTVMQWWRDDNPWSQVFLRHDVAIFNFICSRSFSSSPMYVNYTNVRRE